MAHPMTLVSLTSIPWLGSLRFKILFRTTLQKSKSIAWICLQSLMTCVTRQQALCLLSSKFTVTTEISLRMQVFHYLRSTIRSLKDLSQLHLVSSHHNARWSIPTKWGQLTWSRPPSSLSIQSQDSLHFMSHKSQLTWSRVLTTKILKWI